MATLLLPDGTNKAVTPMNGKSFSLDELQGFVKGYIEIIGLDNDEVMVINEEGKYQFPGQINENASIRAYQDNAIHFSDVIVGPALICRRNQA